jgi:GAF domain-containing protein
MAVALVLGLSLRPAHKYADLFVDRVFFRKRHDDEEALRRFALETSYITDRSVLLDRALCEVKEHTSADDVVVLVEDGNAEYTSASNGVRLAVGENDPGIVMLRAWGKPVSLHDVRGSALRGDLAFPMISRGRLVGALVCGAKRDGEAFAPDEYDALTALAHGVGTALDTLSNGKTGASAEQKLDSIIEMLASLGSREDKAL